MAPSTINRRQFLASVGTISAAGIAGCSGDKNTGNGTDSTTSTQENRPGEASVKVDKDAVKLPAIWNSQSVDDVSVNVQAQVSDPDGVKSVRLVNDGEAIKEYDNWKEKAEVPVKPDQLKPGENTLTLEAEDKKGEKFSAETTVEKRVPNSYRVDIQPMKHEDLRAKARETEGENYLEEQTPLQDGDQIIEDSKVFNYSTPDELAYNKLGIDLAAMEYLHDNDWRWVIEGVKGNDEKGDTELDQLLNNLDNPEKFPKARKPTDEKPPYPATIVYPNGDKYGGEWGHFEYEEFKDADTAGDALDWLQPLLFHYQAIYTDSGPESTEDWIYAAFLQEAMDQETDIETHFWPFKIDETAGHGNGLVWDETNDELRIMETVGGGMKKHPRIENSEYMEKGNKNGRVQWHPLQFGLEPEEAEKFGWAPDPSTSKDRVKLKVARVQGMIEGMTSTYWDMIGPTRDDPYQHWTKKFTVGSTEYLEDFADKLRNLPRNDTEFQELYNQSKAWSKVDTLDEHTVVYGNVDNPKYAVVTEETARDLMENPLNQDFDDSTLKEDKQYQEINTALEDSSGDIQELLEPGKA